MSNILDELTSQDDEPRILYINRELRGNNDKIENSISNSQRKLFHDTFEGQNKNSGILGSFNNKNKITFQSNSIVNAPQSSNFSTSKFTNPDNNNNNKYDLVKYISPGQSLLCRNVDSLKNMIQAKDDTMNHSTLCGLDTSSKIPEIVFSAKVPILSTLSNFNVAKAEKNNPLLIYNSPIQFVANPVTLQVPNTDETHRNNNQIQSNIDGNNTIGMDRSNGEKQQKGVGRTQGIAANVINNNVNRLSYFNVTNSKIVKLVSLNNNYRFAKSILRRDINVVSAENRPALVSLSAQTKCDKTKCLNSVTKCSQTTTVPVSDETNNYNITSEILNPNAPVSLQPPNLSQLSKDSFQSDKDRTKLSSFSINPNSQTSMELETAPVVEDNLNKKSSEGLLSECNVLTCFTKTSETSKYIPSSLSMANKVVILAKKPKFISRILNFENVKTNEINKQSNTVVSIITNEKTSSRNTTINPLKILDLKKKKASVDVPEEITRDLDLLKRYFVHHKCLICGFVSKRSRGGERHMIVHMTVKPHKCDKCTKSFATEDRLLSHKLCHESDENLLKHTCEECGRCFKRLGYLREHERRHQKVVRHKCEICQKGFMCMMSLRRHALSHTGERPFKCNVCEKNYGSSNHLVRHLNSHTKDVPYYCDVCDKNFYNHHYYIVHMRAHQHGNVFQCDLCDARFKFKSNLTQHRLTHSEIRKHGCFECGKMFKLPHHLRQHMDTHNSSVPVRKRKPKQKDSKHIEESD